MDGLRSVPSLGRLGLIVGSVVICVVLLFHIRYSSTTISLDSKSGAVVAAQRSQPATAKVRSDTTSSPKFAEPIGTGTQLSKPANL